MGFVIFLIIIGVIIYHIKSSKVAQEQWRMAAKRLNLVYHPGDLGGAGTIMGSTNGHRVTVSTYSKGSGNSSKTYTQYRLAYRDPIILDLRITRQGMLHEVGKVFGLQDIEVGNPAFDDHFIVRGANPDRVRALLTVGLQSALRDLALSYSNSVTVTGNYVEIDKPGKAKDSADIVQTVRRLAGFCEAMMEAGSNESPPENVIEVEERPSAMPIIEIEPPDPAYDQFTPPNPIMPDFPEVQEEEVAQYTEADLEEVIVEEMPELEPSETTAVEPEAPEVAAGPIDLEETAGQLFGGAGSSVMVTKVFDEQFKDRLAGGSGELVHVGKFSYDPIFINAEGIKAVYSVCELRDAYSKIKVVVEVMYPGEQYDHLKARIGSTMPIAGRLIAQDPMMHRLYVIADDS